MKPTRISPSTLDLIAACPKFRYREYDNGKNLSAADGTLVHAALESGNMDDLNEEQERSLKLTQAFVEAQLVGYLDWHNVSPDKRTELHEQKLPSSFGYNGKMDRFYISFASGRAFITDLKMGRLGILADAKDSYQLAAYAEIAWNAFKDQIKEIRVALSSPRTKETSIHDYKYEDLPGIKERIQKVVDDFENPFAPPRVTEHACGKCALLDVCPVAKKDAIVPLAASPLAISPELLMKPVEDLTVTELAANRAAMDLLEKWAELRKPMIDARVFSEGIDLPGYTKVVKTGQPTILADKTLQAWDLLQDEISPVEFASICGKISLKKLIDLFSGNCVGASADDRAEQAKLHVYNLLEDVITKSGDSTYLRRKAKLSSKLLT